MTCFNGNIYNLMNKISIFKHVRCLWTKICPRLSLEQEHFIDSMPSWSDHTVPKSEHTSKSNMVEQGTFYITVNMAWGQSATIDIQPQAPQCTHSPSRSRKEEQTLSFNKHSFLHGNKNVNLPTRWVLTSCITKWTSPRPFAMIWTKSTNM